MFSRDYIEKIVQKAIPLPAIEQRDIDQFLDVHIDKLFDEIKISKEDIVKFQKDFSYIYQTQIRRLFKTLRHAKRYLNGIRSTLPPIKNEINLSDFFILEVIRIFYPRIYNDIWRNPWFYIPLNWSDTTFFLSPFSFSSREDEKYSQIREHIENIIRNEKENDILIELLETIFFVEVKNALGRSKTDYSNVAKSYRAEKRITHPESFRKYFMLKVSPVEISDEFVETTLNLWHSTEKTEKESIIEKTIFEIQKKEILLDFFKKLMVFIDKIQREIVPEIVKVIYKNADKFSRKGTENLWNSEYDKSESLLLWLINDKIDKDKIQNMLEEIVINTPYLPFAVLFVLSCKKERGGSIYNIYESIKIEELQNKVAERLKKYFVNENRDIFDELQEESDWAFVLYQWATNWMTFTGDNNKIVNNYVFSLIKDNVRKYIKFLMHQRVRTVGGSWTFNLEEISRVYNLEELQKLAKKFKDTINLSKEEKDTLEMFLRLLNNPKIEDVEQIKKKIINELSDIFLTEKMMYEYDEYRMKYINHREIFDGLINDGIIVHEKEYCFIHPKALILTEKGKIFLNTIFDPFMIKLKELYKTDKKIRTSLLDENYIKNFYDIPSEHIKRVLICLRFISGIWDQANADIEKSMSFKLTEGILDFPGSEIYFKSKLKDTI